MLAIRRLASASLQHCRWDKLVSKQARPVSLSACMFKKFPQTDQQKIVYLPSDREEITVLELQQRMNFGRKRGIIGSLLDDVGIKLHVLNYEETVIPMDVAELIVLECDMIPMYKHPEKHQERKQTQQSYRKFAKRPPVVTIMGHVDHGKTTLLDYLRKTAVVKQEAGGITQHIGAFSVTLENNKTVTFIDTPGHAAFNSMRARGAYVTDMVVLVVAADDGVKAQTVESLQFILPENIPVIVALNKIDKPNLNLEKVKSQLLGFGLFFEEAGGDVQCVEISALKGTNIPNLIEAILLQAESLRCLRVNHAGNAEGIILESRMDGQIGPVATVLLGQGKLKVGAFVTAGTVWGKVKAMKDWEDKPLTVATPSMPVQVTGWKEVPNAGDAVFQVQDKTAAVTAIEARRNAMGNVTSDLVDVKPMTSRNLEILKTLKYNKMTNQSLEVHPKLKYNNQNRVDLVIKGDVTGSVEAILQALKTFSSDQVIMSVLDAGVGNVTETDVTTVAAFKGTILAFNVRTLKGVEELAAANGVTIRKYSVIYKLLYDLKQTIAAKLPPVRVDTEKGRAVVLQKFKLSGARKSVVAGCNVKSGVLNKEDSFKVLRYNKPVYEGKVATMKKGPEDATSISSGSDCGLAFEDFTDFHQGDNIVCFTSEYVKQEVDWELGF